MDLRCEGCVPWDDEPCCRDDQEYDELVTDLWAWRSPAVPSPDPAQSHAKWLNRAGRRHGSGEPDPQRTWPHRGHR